MTLDEALDVVADIVNRGGVPYKRFMDARRATYYNKVGLAYLREMLVDTASEGFYDEAAYWYGRVTDRRWGTS